MLEGYQVSLSRSNLLVLSTGNISGYYAKRKTNLIPISFYR